MFARRGSYIHRLQETGPLDRKPPPGLAPRGSGRRLFAQSASSNRPTWTSCVEAEKNRDLVLVPDRNRPAKRPCNTAARCAPVPPVLSIVPFRAREELSDFAHVTLHQKRTFIITLNAPTLIRGYAFRRIAFGEMCALRRCVEEKPHRKEQCRHLGRTSICSPGRSGAGAPCRLLTSAATRTSTLVIS